MTYKRNPSSLMLATSGGEQESVGCHIHQRNSPWLNNWGFWQGRNDIQVIISSAASVKEFVTRSISDSPNIGQCYFSCSKHCVVYNGLLRQFQPRSFNKTERRAPCPPAPLPPPALLPLRGAHQTLHVFLSEAKEREGRRKGRREGGKEGGGREVEKEEGKEGRRAREDRWTSRFKFDQPWELCRRNASGRLC